VLPTDAVLPAAAAGDESEPSGHQAHVASLVPGIRWGLLALAGFLAVVRGPRVGGTFAWCAVLVAFAAWMTWRPAAAGAAGASGREGGVTAGRARAPGPAPASDPSVEAHPWVPPMIVMVEVFIVVLAVDSTGYWASPFAYCLLTAVVVAGFSGGFGLALRTAALLVLAVGIPAHLHIAHLDADSIGVTGQWALELALVAVLAGYARKLFGEVEERHSQSLDRISQLAEANDLLVSLHRVAQTLPASLDLDQVLTSTVDRLRSLIDSDVVAVLVHDDTTGTWTVAASEGAVASGPLTDNTLPLPLRAATSSSVTSLVVSLAPGEGYGPPVVSKSGLYAPLRARDSLVGLVAVEHHEPGRYGRRELRLLDGFIEPAALAIDNARWFGRLRAMGAAEERTRIARDMHDRIGQSLAYVAFELDRITRLAAGQPLEAELDGLRGEVRGVLGEVRDTLSDLRSDVSDQRDLAETLDAYLARVASRGDVEVDYRRDATERLPVVQERELWRIAQEAITNVERHARARHLRVRWACDGRSARLTVADDGRGFGATANRLDSFGITGMKERADAIGATLEIESEPYVGTLVECRLELAS
jgi:signal transduction histidine kinase